MGLKGQRDRNDEPSDEESEREALRRQRLEAASELATLKRTLSERVAEVQQRERELAEALARVEKREQKLESAEGRGSRLDSVRLRLAEAKEARTALDARRAELDAREQALDARDAAFAEGERVVSTQTPPAPPDTAHLDARAAELDERESSLADRATTLDEREQELAARAAGLDSREQELEARERERGVPTQTLPPAPDSEDEDRIEERLTELREAEKAFARTQHELAARSEALSEQEAELATRERALAARETPEAKPDIEALEARIRRLEQGGGTSSLTEEPQTFSAGLRALQERGLRGGREPDPPLH